ncbi:MAG: DUF4249 domain-containing protein [Bacteroidales bacterium]|nr:DUF4249 domain-containing protein [Bacteroidales bacterium]
MRKVLLIILGIGLVSCEREISDEFTEEVGNTFVLSGMISGGEYPRVNVSETIGLLEEDSVKHLNDAMVEANYHSDSYFLKNLGGGEYIGEVIIEPGDSIQISCTGNDLPEATVSLKVPELPVISDFSYFIDSTYNLHIEMDLIDPSDSKDFYNIRSEGINRHIEYYNGLDDKEPDTTFSHGFYTTILHDSIADYLANDGGRFHEVYSGATAAGRIVYFTDEGFNGKTQHLYIELSLVYTYNDSIPEIKFQVAKTDENIFSFIESYIRYDPNPDIEIIQPAKIYSNIENGFGLLLSESKRTYIIDVEDVYTDPDFLEYYKNNW